MKGKLEAQSSAPDQPFGIEVSALGLPCPTPEPQEQGGQAFQISWRLAAPGHKGQVSRPKTFQRLSSCSLAGVNINDNSKNVLSAKKRDFVIVKRYYVSVKITNLKQIGKKNI